MCVCAGMRVYAVSWAYVYLVGTPEIQMNNMGRSPKRHAKLFRTHTLRFIDFGHVLGHEHDGVAQKNGVFFRFVQNSFF